jgi:hypothetical protein
MRGFCLAFVIIAIVAAFLLGTYVVYSTLAGEPNEIRIDATVDQQVIAANSPFTITVEVENVDLDTVTLKAVGLDEDLLAGATVVSIDPATRTPQENSYPLVGTWTEYPLARRLLGGDTLTVTITLNATTPGVYSGELSMWVEGDLLGINTSRARRTTLDYEVQ